MNHKVFDSEEPIQAEIPVSNLRSWKEFIVHVPSFGISRDDPMATVCFSVLGSPALAARTVGKIGLPNYGPAFPTADKCS